MKPAPMTDGHIDAICINTVNGTTGFALSFARAIIAARDAQWVELLSKQEPVVWIVFDEDGLPAHATIHPQMAHAHINDAMQEFNHMEASKWVVRPVYAHPAPEQEKP